ncbi:hypothetical protein ACFQU2_18750 [Siccirubricoccus deserti]
MAIGQQVRVVLDIYPDVTWTGVVESISPATGAESPSCRRRTPRGIG